MKDEQRQALRRLAAIAGALGLGATLFAGFGSRAVGMPAAGRNLWGLRLFGIRELCLAYGLARAAVSDDPAQGRLMAALVNVAQVGDSLLAGALLARGEVSWRVAVLVWAGVPPTLLATRAARRTV